VITVMNLRADDSCMLYIQNPETYREVLYTKHYHISKSRDVPLRHLPRSTLGPPQSLTGDNGHLGEGEGGSSLRPTLSATHNSPIHLRPKEAMLSLSLTNQD
jgi:hypothetical protein